MFIPAVDLVFVSWCSFFPDYNVFVQVMAKQKNLFPDLRAVPVRNDRVTIFQEFLCRLFLSSSLSLQVAGDPHECHDPYPVRAPVVEYEDCAAGGAGVFSADDGRGVDGDGPWDGVCPLLYVDPCQGLPVIPCGTCVHGVLVVVCVLVP